MRWHIEPYQHSTSPEPQGRELWPILRPRLRLGAMVIAIGFLPAGVSSSAHAGGIYKSTDDAGNIVFTDQPLEGAETISDDKAQRPASTSVSEGGEPPDEDDQDEDLKEPPPATMLVAPQPKTPPKPKTAEPEDPNNFLPITRVEILTPSHDTTFLDPLGQIWIEVQSYPTPMSQSGLIAQLWMNDKLITSDTSTMLRLPPPARGTHVLRVKLVDKKGRLFQVSHPVHIHVKYRLSEQ